MVAKIGQRMLRLTGFFKPRFRVSWLTPALSELISR